MDDRADRFTPVAWISGGPLSSIVCVFVFSFIQHLPREVLARVFALGMMYIIANDDSYY